MRKSILGILLILGVIVNLCACGTKDTTNQATSSNIEKTATASDVTFQRTAEDEYPFANSKRIYHYLLQYGEDYIGVIERKLDGTLVNQTKISNLMSIVCVKEDWLYYLVCEYGKESDQTILYRVPLSNNGEPLKIDQAEKIFVEEDDVNIDFDIYVGERYILYCTEDWELVEYDMKTKRRTSITSTKGETEEIEPYYLVYSHKEFALIEGEYGDVYRYDFATGALTKTTQKFGTCITTTKNGEFVYYYDMDSISGREENLWQYDVGKDTSLKVVSLEMLTDVVEREEELEREGKTLRRVIPVDLFATQDTLYIQYQLDCKKGNEYWVENGIVSMNMKRQELVYEKELTELIRSRVDVETWKEKLELEGEALKEWNIQFNHSGAFELIGNLLFISSTNANGDSVITCYNLETKEHKVITKEDSEFYLPCCTDAEYQEGDATFEIFWNPWDL